MNFANLPPEVVQMLLGQQEPQGTQLPFSPSYGIEPAPEAPQRSAWDSIAMGLAAGLPQMPAARGAGASFAQGLARGFAMPRAAQVRAREEGAASAAEDRRKQVSEAARSLRAFQNELRLEAAKAAMRPQAADKTAQPITAEEAKRMGHPEFEGMTREDARLMLNAKDAKSGEVTPTARLGFINTLTDNARLDMKSWGNVRDGYRRIKTAQGLTSGPGDLALIFSYMKILDPDSTIMPSEYKNAAEAVGFDERLKNVPKWVLEGDKLSPQGRKWFVDAAKGLYKQRLADAQETLAQYRAQAQMYGIDPKLAIGRYERMIMNDAMADSADTPTPDTPVKRTYPQAGRRVQ